MTKKTLIPNDIRDWLSILSFIGFIAIFLSFSLDYQFLSDNLTAIFLITAGAILLMVGKVISIRSWLRDGLQTNEFSQLFAIVFGFGALIIGLMMFFTTISSTFFGLIGLLAIPPAIFILLDYFAKNT